MSLRPVVAVLAVAGALAGCGPASPPAAASRSVDGIRATPTPTPARSVAVEGVTFALPDGWTTAPAGCGGPPERTVTVGTYAGSCGAAMPGAPVPTGVAITALYGPGVAEGWQGRRTTWHGQPAWVARETIGGGTTVTLTLPWENAAVAARSSDAATARALLDRVSAGAGPGLAVPPAATRVVVEAVTGHDGDGRGRRVATVTDADDVRRLLADLRALPPVTSPARACDGSWWGSTAVLTVRGPAGDRSYAARFGTCGLVVGGTGVAAGTSEALLRDVRRLVPDSAL